MKVWCLIFTLYFVFVISAHAIRGGDELPVSQITSHQKSQIQLSVVKLISISGDETKYACSGSIVGEDLVLTSAHCFDTGHGQWQIHHNHRQYDVTAIGIHKAYRREEVMDAYWNYLLEIRLHHDLALVKTASKLYTPNLNPNLALIEEHETKASVDVFLAGYGQTEHLFGIGKGEGVLRVAGPVSLDRANLIRIAIKNQPVGGCLGDSGGPLLTEIDGRLRVMGVLSQSDCMGDTTYQQVDRHSLVSSAFDWGPLKKRVPKIVKE